MIHKTAIIDPKAKISSNVKIGAYSIIGPNVEIDENSEIQTHVSIVGNTKIGKNNKIYPFSSIGNDPQDLKFNGEKTNLEIGDNNKIREYVTINPGTIGGGGLISGIAIAAKSINPNIKITGVVASGARGMKESEMKIVADLIVKVLDNINDETETMVNVRQGKLDHARLSRMRRSVKKHKVRKQQGLNKPRVGRSTKRK